MVSFPGRAAHPALASRPTRTVSRPGTVRDAGALLIGVGLGLAVLAVALGVAGRPIPAAVTLTAGIALAARAYTRSRREIAQMTEMLTGQTHILEMAATEGSVGEVLDALCMLVERQEPGLISSVLLLDGDRLRDGAGPSLPAPYRRAIDGVTIGPDVGSCGTAAFTRQPVVVHAIASDPRWVAYREVALRHGLLACWSAPILTADDECLGTFAMYYREQRRPDVREWRLLEAAVHVARLAIIRARTADALAASRRRLEDLETAAQHRLEFISTISHELRTPLGVILGYAEMLADDATPADRAAWLAGVRRAGGELLDLIDATLDLNQLEAGREPPRLEPVALRAFLADLAADFAVVACPRDVELRWEAGDAVTLVTDRRKLRTILKNLIGNALKFTTAGSIAVRYRIAPDACTFEVADTGAGIAPEHLPGIFEMFRQVDGSDRRSFSGVGLGLHIVRRLVEQLGGEVKVTSEPGRGSTFTVSLPSVRDEARSSA